MKVRELIINIDDFISVVDYDNQMGLEHPIVSHRVFKIKEFQAIRKNKDEIISAFLEEACRKTNKRKWSIT